MKTMSNLELRILQLLSHENAPKEGLTALQIAKCVIGSHAKKNNVNPTLYKLMRDDKVVKIDIPLEINPKWIIKHKEIF